ncbi:uncharacterized protein B0T15DRAFT_534085, partial [Chaetomium strumarium]
MHSHTTIRALLLTCSAITAWAAENSECGIECRLTRRPSMVPKRLRREQLTYHLRYGRARLVLYNTSSSTFMGGPIGGSTSLASSAMIDIPTTMSTYVAAGTWSCDWPSF